MSDFAKYWNYPLTTLTSGTQITVSQLVLTALLVVAGLVVAWYLQRLIGRQLIKAKVNPNVTETVQRILFYGILILLLVTAPGMLHIPVTALAFISGGVAIGVGFGAQKIINNLISGWILMRERPVQTISGFASSSISMITGLSSPSRNGTITYMPGLWWKT
jgi:small-conductance mechanosensitive channel